VTTEQSDDNQVWFDSQTPERTARTRGIRRVLIVVLLLNVLVALAKLGYGLLTESVSMTADGAQSMLDGLSNVIGLVSIAVAARPPDEEHHYGHDRYETLASLIIAMMMAISALEISRSAVGQLLSGNSPTVNAGSFIVLVCTMIVNLWVSWWENWKGRELKSDYLTADSRHTLSDVFVSSGVILGLLAVQAGYGRADGVISIGIAGIIAWAAWTILRDASLVLTDAVQIDPRILMEAILHTDGVKTAHKLRARSMGGRLLVEVDITVDPQLRVDRAHDVATNVERSVKRVAGWTAQALVHVEPAVAPHTRPDRLFGDVQVNRNQAWTDKDPDELDS
jgi:cation diffusion facilitator family transporter